jgi:hypothetical protein
MAQVVGHGFDTRRGSKLFPSISKFLWFQCQAFPKIVLVVLWIFKGLQ